MKSRGRTIAPKHPLGILCAGVLLFLLGSVGVSCAPTAPVEPDIRRDATVRAVEIVLPSVVNIATAAIKQYADFYDPIFQQYYGPIRQREELYNIGSGIIINEEGDILTNLHVMQRATRAQVKLWNGRIYEVKSYIASSGSDLALLRLVTKPGEKFKPIKFAPDDDLLLGETVIALGNPFGLGGSVSRGILSSKNRSHPNTDVAPEVQEWLQTDAAINPGNSGGPLVNLRGELIGVNSGAVGQGIGYAIPMKQVIKALSEVLSPESTDLLWLGARVRPEEDGLKIDFVQPDSPADKAGLRADQRIFQVDGNSVKNLMDFNRFITETRGRSVALQVQQGSETRLIKVQLVPFDDLIRQKLGFTLTNLTSETAATFNMPERKGLLIQDVEKNGPADQAQIQKGFLLTDIDGKNADNLVAVGSILVTKKTGAIAQLTVIVPRQLNGTFVEFRQATVTVQIR